jgi:hypothetical protein
MVRILGSAARSAGEGRSTPRWRFGLVSGWFPKSPSCYQEKIMLRHLSILAALALLAGGCSRGPYQVAPVSGRITLNGKPVPSAAVLFQPVAPEGNINPGPGSTGITDADGRYTLTLTRLDGAKGAVVGKHKVRIAAHDDTPQDPSDDRPRRPKKQLVKIPAKYNQIEALLEFDVPAKGTTSADFAMTSP